MKRICLFLNYAVCFRVDPLWAVETPMEGGVQNPFFAMLNCTGADSGASLPERLKILKDLGYAGTSYSGVEGLEEVLRALDVSGLELFALYIGVNLDPGASPYDPGLEEAIRLLDGRETIIWLYLRSEVHKPSSVEADPRAVELVGKIADMAKGPGLRIALYPHIGFWLERVEDAVRIAEKVGRENVGVTFNLCHWLILDDAATLEARLESASPHLFVVTLNGISRDVKPDAREGWIQPLDQGSYDLEPFLRSLRRLGYTGPIGLQCYGIEGDFRENLERSMTAWRALSKRLAADIR
jgi:sugar phosphate isomerase/epimerase